MNTIEKKYTYTVIKTDEKSNLYAQTHKGIHGETILNPKLNYSDNEIFIRNIHLMSRGKVATNTQDKYDFFYVYVIAGTEPIDKGNYFFINDTIQLCITNKNGNILAYNGETYSTKKCKRILASNDTSLNCYQLTSDTLKAITVSDTPFIKVAYDVVKKSYEELASEGLKTDVSPYQLNQIKLVLQLDNNRIVATPVKKTLLIKDLKEDFLNGAKTRAISSNGDIFEIGDRVIHEDTKSGKAVITSFDLDVDSNEVIAQTTKGWAHISFIHLDYEI